MEADDSSAGAGPADDGRTARSRPTTFSRVVTGLAVAVGILAGSLVAGITDLSWPESAVPAALAAGVVAGAGVALGQLVERRRAAARTATRE